MATVYNSTFDIDGEAAGDYSGWYVSTNSDGTIVAIGAIYNDGTASNAGHTRVYQYSGGAWNQLGADIDGEATNDLSGYSVSINGDGTIVAIGSVLHDGSATNAGQTRVFQYSGGSWSQLGAGIDGEAASDQSGYSMSINSDGTIVAIGANINDGTGTSAGHVRVYQYSGGSWNQLGADIDGETAGDRSGTSVSINSDGTIVAIGAIYNSDNGIDSGQTRVFQYSGSTWSQLGVDIDGEAAGDVSGYSVSISSDGTIVAISAVVNDGNGSNSGHARVYQFSGGSWSQLGADIDGEAAGDQSGFSISINGDGTIVAIGANVNGSVAGHVRVYQYSGGSWSQLGADIDGEAAGDQSGRSVSINNDGTVVSIGAIGSAFSTGQTRVFQYINDAWNQNVSFNLCLGEGTLISTNQGNIPIEQLDIEKHTIKNKPIRGILHAKMTDSKIIRINKDALGPNIPNAPLFVSRGHKVRYNSHWIKADRLITYYTVAGVKRIPHHGEKMYNILMDEYCRVNANGLKVETLHPSEYTKSIVQNNVEMEVFDIPMM
jgi:hypothetical protein